MNKDYSSDKTKLILIGIGAVIAYAKLGPIGLIIGGCLLLLLS